MHHSKQLLDIENWTIFDRVFAISFFLLLFWQQITCFSFYSHTMLSCICAPYTNLIIHSMMLYYLLREQAASEEVDSVHFSFYSDDEIKRISVKKDHQVRAPWCQKPSCARWITWSCIGTHQWYWYVSSLSNFWNLAPSLASLLQCWVLGINLPGSETVYFLVFWYQFLYFFGREIIWHCLCILETE